MLRLIGLLVMTGVGVGGLMALDFNMSRQAAIAENDDGLTFREYIGGFSERIASATGSAGASNLPTALTEMLPRPPEGWTQRATTREDIEAVLPKRSSDAEREARRLVESVGETRVGNGAEVVVLTYERGERRVVIQAIRYPDHIFTGFAARQQRFDLKMVSASVQGRPFMTVRGLDVTEAFLGDGIRGRLFVADVGAQIHLRVLASRRMKDEDLVPFFETLHVKAMNAAVVDRKEGLGEVPVIVLASAMGEVEREAYEADHAQRRADAAAKAEADLQVAEAKAEAATKAEAFGTPDGEVAVAAEAETPKAGIASDCEKGAGGTKRCSVGAGD